MFKKLLVALILPLLFSLATAFSPPFEETLRRPFREWRLEEALSILNDSPWARRITSTQVLSEVGSGRQGEKEILRSFYVRILSARPVREALARVEQIRHAYDQLQGEERHAFDRLLQPGLNLDVDRWIVVSVQFRSNDRNREREVKNYLQNATRDSLQNRAFLSTRQFNQVRMQAYFPPAGDGLGARFVFPRFVDGRAVIQPDDEQLAFELEIPRIDPPLRVEFAVEQLVVDGEMYL